jgi:cytochrome c-type biogenesis protein CcmF
VVVGTLAWSRRNEIAGFADRYPETPMARLPVDNLLLIVFAFSLMWASLFPLLGAALREERVSVGLPLVSRPSLSWWILVVSLTAAVLFIVWRSAPRRRREWIRPLVIGAGAATLARVLGVRDSYLLVAVALAGCLVATVAAGRPRTTPRARGEWRRQCGGSLARIGVLTVAIAFVALAFRVTSEMSVGPGETARLGDPYGHSWTFTSQGVSRFQELNRHVVAVALVAEDRGHRAGIIRAERRDYVDSRDVATFDSSMEAGILSMWRQDAYIVLLDVAGDRARLRVAFHPAASWVWLGGALICIGGVLVMWPSRSVAT